MRRFTTVLSCVALTLLPSCSLLPADFLPATKVRPTYNSPAELAKSLRNRQISDGAMSFVAKYHVQGMNVTDGSGSLAMGLSKTDTTMHFSAGATDPGFDLISIGVNVYSRTLTGGGQPWKAYSIDQYAEGGPLLVDTLLFARIDAIADEMTLSGSASSAETSNDTYRLRGTWQGAINAEMRDIGSSVTVPVYGTPTPLELNLTIGPDDRLISASWVTTAHGGTASADYTFADWGKPVAIAAPVTG